MHEAQPESVGKGHLGLGASLASVEFKDVKSDTKRSDGSAWRYDSIQKENRMLPEKVYGRGLYAGV